MIKVELKAASQVGETILNRQSTQNSIKYFDLIDICIEYPCNHFILNLLNRSEDIFRFEPGHQARARVLT